ncbi:hypothetical protein QQS21_012650 [Conoideocrella luteorostrata]|uniref:Uncharacterized protein n=1 Tax=Conoideocrella luteorostrata TaxID=1105319 RepID=A0AAJ0CAT1_9HYPO|nr:hypothetical protein QQS21_012650 [Conoideocrella luteorostrata]
MCKYWINREDGESDTSRWRYLHQVCNLDGFELSPLNVDIDETSLLNPISYKRDPDYRTGGEYIGNQHEEMEEIYSDMVLVIVRADSLHAPLIGRKYLHPQHMDSVIRHLQAGINDSTKTTTTTTTLLLQKILVRICRVILDQGFAAEAANDVYLGYAAVTAAFLGDWPLFEEARKKTLRTWDCDTWSALGGLIDLQDPPTKMDDGFCRNNNNRKDLAKAEYWKQWYSDTLIKTLDMCDTSSGGEDATTVKEIIMDLKIQYTPEQREVKEFANALNVELLLELSNAENVRREFLGNLFGVISEFAISTFDFDLYYSYIEHLRYTNTNGLIRDFYKQVLARDEDLASNLLRQLSNKASNVEKTTARLVLGPLMKELLPWVDTGSLEVQTCFQSLVEAYITKVARSELNIFLEDPEAKEKTIALAEDGYQRHVRWCFPYLSETGNWGLEGEVRFTKTLQRWGLNHHRWESNVKAAQEKLQQLPKDALKQALGDKYNTLMALDPIKIDKTTAQAPPDKAQPSPSQQKCMQGSKDANNTAPGRTSKRVRRRTSRRLRDVKEAEGPAAAGGSHKGHESPHERDRQMTGVRSSEVPYVMM